MTTYKFLAAGAIGAFSRFAWPTPHGDAAGAWIEVDGPLDVCARGVHVCRGFELAHWLHDELWQTEIAGDTLEGVDCLVVRRARLVRRIAGWQDGGAARFAAACAEHAAAQVGRAPAARAYVDDAEVCARMGYAAVGAHCAAFAVAALAGPADRAAAYRGERAWQADWIVRTLIAA